MIVQRQDQVRTVVVTPRRFKGGVVVVVRERVTGLVIDCHQCMEGQALQDAAEIEVQTGVKLELTAHPGILTGRIVIGDNIGRLSQRTTKEILAINDIA